jgi:hypothetical protein
MKKLLLIVLTCLFAAIHFHGFAQSKPRFKAIVMAENGGHHIEFSKSATSWLNQLAADSNFSVQYIQNTDLVDSAFLAPFELFIQLDFPPYAWKPAAEQAFIQFMGNRNKRWIGFHHASLLGEFDGYPMWNWFWNFMGGIRFKNYIPGFASGKITVEQPQHPVMKGLPSSFTIAKEEWYTYDKNPRPNVNVLASVDESLYQPDSEIKMGDHPVIWTNEKMAARNVYIFMGHSADLLVDKNFTTLFRNAIFWR